MPTGDTSDPSGNTSGFPSEFDLDIGQLLLDRGFDFMQKHLSMGNGELTGNHEL